MHWPSRQLGETDLIVGPCAWRLDMLGEDAAADFVREHPSLIIITPDDDDAQLAAAAPRLGDLPVLLVVDEPFFVRRLEGEIRRRAALLGREHLAAVMLHVDDPADLKGGGMLQVLFDLRQNGFCDHLGLAHRDARHVEWLAKSTAVRLLGMDYHLHNQQVAYRALAVADDFGVASIALWPPPADDRDAMRFSLGSRGRVLPVLDRAGARHLSDVSPMDETELATCWQDYQTTHSEPAALLRSQPPD